MTVFNAALKEAVQKSQLDALLDLEKQGSQPDPVAVLLNRGSTEQEARAIHGFVHEVADRVNGNRDRTPDQKIQDALVQAAGGRGGLLSVGLQLEGEGGAVPNLAVGTALEDAAPGLATAVVASQVGSLEALATGLPTDDDAVRFNLADYACVSSMLDEPFGSPRERDVTVVTGGALHQAAKKVGVKMAPEVAGGLATVAVTSVKTAYKLAAGQLNEDEALDRLERTTATVVEVFLSRGLEIGLGMLGSFIGLGALSSVAGQTLAKVVAPPVARLVAKGVRKVTEVARRVWHERVKPMMVRTWEAVTSFARRLFA